MSASYRRVALSAPRIYAGQTHVASGHATNRGIAWQDGLARQVDALACHLLGAQPTRRTRDEIRFGRRGSLQITTQGPYVGWWRDYEAGIGGDALGLVAYLLRCSMREAAIWARAWLGMTGHDMPATPVSRPAGKAGDAPMSKTADLARRIWREAGCAAESPVTSYLASRGLVLPPNAPIRFHPHCPRGCTERLPAMLALMTNPTTAEPCGVHRTFLKPDGSGKADGDEKLMAGNAGVIRLVPDVEVAAGLGLAEGIETSLAIMQRFGWSPVWATGSAGGTARFPVQPGIEALRIFADGDKAGQAAARCCAERWHAAGREAAVTMAPASRDFADRIDAGAA